MTALKSVKGFTVQIGLYKLGISRKGRKEGKEKEKERKKEKEREKGGTSKRLQDAWRKFG